MKRSIPILKQFNYKYKSLFLLKKEFFPSKMRKVLDFQEIQLSRQRLFSSRFTSALHCIPYHRYRWILPSYLSTYLYLLYSPPEYSLLSQPTSQLLGDDRYYMYCVEESSHTNTIKLQIHIHITILIRNHYTHSFHHVLHFISIQIVEVISS